MSEFVSISKQSIKDKINSKDIIERFLFSWFDSLVKSQIAVRVCALRSLRGKGCGIVGREGGVEKNIKN